MRDDSFGLICPVCDQMEFEDDDEYFEHVSVCFEEEDLRKKDQYQKDDEEE